MGPFRAEAYRSILSFRVFNEACLYYLTLAQLTWTHGSRKWDMIISKSETCKRTKLAKIDVVGPTGWPVGDQAG